MAANPTPRLQPEPAVDAVVFDFDGTLVASRFVDEAAVAELIAHDPAAAAGAPLFWSHEGEPILHRIELARPGRGAEIMPLFERQAPPRSFPGVSRLLRRIAALGLPMAVVSSRRRGALDQGLEATGLRRHFPVVIGLEDVREPKPSPEGLLQALWRLDVEPSRALFVGDSELDVEAGRRGGVRVWRAIWGLPPLRPVPAQPAGTIFLRRPEEVGERLERLAADADSRRRRAVGPGRWIIPASPPC